MYQQEPWPGIYVKNIKLILTFFSKKDFSGFLICVINVSGVAFGQVASLLEFIPHHMEAFPDYMCLDFQASYSFKCWKASICVPHWLRPLGPALQIMVIFEVLCAYTSTIKPNLGKRGHWPNMGIPIHFWGIIREWGRDFRKPPFKFWGHKMKY